MPSAWSGSTMRDTGSAAGSSGISSFSTPEHREHPAQARRWGSSLRGVRHPSSTSTLASASSSGLSWPITKRTCGATRRTAAANWPACGGIAVTSRTTAASRSAAAWVMARSVLHPMVAAVSDKIAVSPLGGEGRRGAVDTWQAAARSGKIGRQRGGRPTAAAAARRTLVSARLHWPDRPDHTTVDPIPSCDLRLRGLERPRREATAVAAGCRVRGAGARRAGAAVAGQPRPPRLRRAPRRLGTRLNSCHAVETAWYDTKAERNSLRPHTASCRWRRAAATSAPPSAPSTASDRRAGRQRDRPHDTRPRAATLRADLSEARAIARKRTTR